MASASPAPARPSATKWGDREGRRRDILSAARPQLAARGYLALSMRDIARGAGVSPGTLYSYFATKDEIFATLYAEAIDAHNERIAPMCEQATDVAALLEQLITTYLELYGSYGRSFTVWSVVHDDDAPGEHDLPAALLATLREAALRQAELIHSGIRRAAAVQEVVVVDEPYVMPFLWMTLNGIAENLTGERRHLLRQRPEDLIAHAARTIAAGITR